MAPVRVQRKRTKGWRMPENTIYVGRGSKWGNPYPAYEMYSEGNSSYLANRYDVCVLYRKMIEREGRAEEIKKELRGKNLACWCAPGDHCHADILLELANDK